jgi:excinuclease ABC subunit C
MTKDELGKLDLPDQPGVYRFLAGRNVLYVGKATSLKDRTRSYFSPDLIRTRGPAILRMVEEAESVEWTVTDSVLEALIMEAALIKRIQPPYNVKEKDDKSYNFVAVTDEDFPRVLVVRGREAALGLTAKGEKAEAYRNLYGPFPSGTQLKEALAIVRKIFPFRDKCTPAPEAKKPARCFNAQIGLCPGVCDGSIGKTEYKRMVRHIELFFDARKTEVRKSLEKQMKELAKAREFEKAEQVKRQLFALDHIRDVNLIKKETSYDPAWKRRGSYRIEAYDIAHLSGTDTVGVMTVVTDGEPDKAEYRKFRIKGQAGTVAVNDVLNLSEVLRRRLGHLGWALPDLIVVDGSTAQVRAAEQVLTERGFDIEIAAVVKDEAHRPREILGKKGTATRHKDAILLANAEAHRFAQDYHKILRSKRMRGD